MIEMLIVMVLIALVAGVSYPSVSSGIASLRLRAAGDSIAGFLTSALDRAERRQQTIEVVISPADNALIARSSDAQYVRRLEVPDPVRITAVRPALAVESLADGPQARRFILYPGGGTPRIGVEIMLDGRRRVVTVDPLTGFPRSEVVPR